MALQDLLHNEDSRLLHVARDAGHGRRSAAAGASGFTLAELLITIGIIVLLAAIVFPAVNAALRKAEQARARAEISSIAASIKAYYGEYGRMPAKKNGVSDTVFDSGQHEVIHILRAVDDSSDNPGDKFNRRKIVFLDVPADSLDSNGNFLDPWGSPYRITMDTDFDGGIKFGGLSGDFGTYVKALSPKDDGFSRGNCGGLLLGSRPFGYKRVFAFMVELMRIDEGVMQRSQCKKSSGVYVGRAVDGRRCDRDARGPPHAGPPAHGVASRKTTGRNRREADRVGLARIL